MTSRKADLEKAWAHLRDGVDYIMYNPEKSMSFARYSSLYTIIYNYCGPNQWENGKIVYNKLNEYLKLHLQSMLEETMMLSDMDLLRCYAAQWDRYTTSINCLNRVFTYLNRFWIKRERDEGKKGVFQVYTLALAQWKEHFFMPIQRDNTKLTTATLRLITAQRNGESIDQSLLKKVVDSFVSLGLDIADPNKEYLDVYKEQFETALIQTTETYYRNESQTFLSENSVSDYLKKVEERLQEEENRVERYLHSTTRKELISKCENVLIRGQRELMWESFQNLLDFDRDEDLQRMYSLLSRLFDGLEPLRELFEARVKQAGLAAMSGLVGEAGVNVNSLDPKVYVDTLLEVQQKNSEIIIRNFKGEAGFTASLDKACREFVNRNAATGMSSIQSAEHISKHVDMLLRKKNKILEDSELEGAFDRVIILLKYVEDRDVFQTFYTTKLSKRLIHGVSASEESEASMISKLKEACGFNYSSKLLRMLTDMKSSKDITDSFKNPIAQGHGDMDIAFSIMVLGINFWPLKPPPHNFVIPQEILSIYDRFQKFYKTKHSGRKLMWLWNYSKNELRTNYLNQKYILMTSSYQMAVLLQYNQNDTMSLNELVSATAISKDILAEVLAVLVKAKVLINDETDQFYLNINFKSKKIRVNLNLPIKAEARAESADVSKVVDEHRKYVILATTLRIMKARKKIRNQALIQEVILQISEHIPPKIPDINMAIRTLLEKDFIAREGNDLVYIP